MKLKTLTLDGLPTLISSIRNLITKDEIGLSNVENKSSEDIRNEITYTNVVEALEYTPSKEAELTQSEYDALSDEEKNNGTTYYITDADANGEASTVGYSNTTSGLSATTVQDAIDEIYARTDIVENEVSTLQNDIETVNSNLSIYLPKKNGTVGSGVWSTDFDDYVQTGAWSCGNITACTNTPTITDGNSMGVLFVFNASTFIFQQYITKSKIYTRIYFSSWNEWY